MFFFYILRSEKTGKYYIGSTGDFQSRLAEHNSNKSPYTRNRGPWKMIYKEPFATLSLARKREQEIKAWKNPGYMVRKLGLNNSLGERPD
jgi:putative endonuclease